MSDVSTAFEETLDEGVHRLRRTWPDLLATGTVGGIDVSVGVLALFIVDAKTHQPLLGSVAFTIGFIALTLANSELFTENFLMPIAAVATGQGTVADLVRLWAGTLTTNLAGGWLMMVIVIGGLPEVGPTAVDIGRHYPAIGIGWQSFAAALLGGAIVTLMTWMERSTESVPAKLVAAAAAGFLLAAGELDHVIVASLEMFAALIAGAPFGYLDAFGAAAWAALGNMVGGVMLVTCLRLVQVGKDKLDEESAGVTRR